MGKVIKPVTIVNGRLVDEVVGIGTTDTPGIIGLVWRDCEGTTVAFPIPIDEAIRLTRMLLSHLGPQEPMPADTAQDHPIRPRRGRS